MIQAGHLPEITVWHHRYITLLPLDENHKSCK